MDFIYNGDGSIMYVSNYGTDEIHQYDLSVNYDISTAVFNQVVIAAAVETDAPRAIEFNSDGTEFYLVSVVSDTVNRYMLTTPYDLATATFDTSIVKLSDGVVEDLVFIPGDDTKFYTIGYATDLIQLYDYDNVF